MESYDSVKRRGKVKKDYMERMMNDENNWDHKVKGDAVEGPGVCVSREVVLQTSNEIKRGPSDVSLELIAASKDAEFQYQRVLH